MALQKFDKEERVHLSTSAYPPGTLISQAESACGWVAGTCLQTFAPTAYGQEHIPVPKAFPSPVPDMQRHNAFMKRSILLAGASLLMCACSYVAKDGRPVATFDATDASDSEAAPILLKMEEMYAGLDTYSDTGIVEDKETKTKTEFKTVYKSPGKLYLEYRDGKETFFIAASGKKNPEFNGSSKTDSRAWLADIYAQGYAKNPGQRFPAQIDRGTIDFAISYLMSGSTSSFDSVPSMLFPIEEGFHFRHMRDAVLQDKRETVNGVECYVIRGDFYPYAVWISTKTYALYKLVHGRAIEESGLTVIYNPVLNPKINDAVFEFKPPPGAQRSPVLHRSSG